MSGPDGRPPCLRPMSVWRASMWTRRCGASAWMGWLDCEMDWLVAWNGCFPPTGEVRSQYTILPKSRATRAACSPLMLRHLQTRCRKTPMKPRHLEQVGIEWRLRKKHFGDVGWLVGWLVGSFSSWTTSKGTRSFQPKMGGLL